MITFHDRKNVLLFSGFLVFLCFTFSLTAEENGLAIMEKVYAVPEGESFQKSSILLIINSGKTEKKEFVTISKKNDRSWRSNLQFTFPARVGFLVWNDPGEDSHQWIKLSSGKVRKIATSEKSKPWMNSHFYNQDISRNYIEDSEYTLMGEELMGEILCYKIRAERTKGEKVYSYTNLYIGKEDYLRYRVEFFENGLMTKVLDYSNYELIDGIFTPRKLTMSRTDGLGKSVLYTKDVIYKMTVNDRELTREAF